MEAVKEWGMALQFASKELQKDKEIVLEAIKQDSAALKELIDEILNILKQKN